MITQTLLSKGATFIASAVANANLSDSAVITAGSDSYYRTGICLMNFDISAIPTSHVESAKLCLFVFAKSNKAPSTVLVNRITSDWNAKTVTYNQRPTLAPTNSCIQVYARDELQFVEIPVTDLVNDWLNARTPNYGLAIQNSDISGTLSFGGKLAGSDYEPQLVVTYQEGILPISRVNSLKR